MSESRRFLSESEKSAIEVRAAIIGYNRRAQTQQHARSADREVQEDDDKHEAPGDQYDYAKKERAAENDRQQNTDRPQYISIIQHSCMRWLFVRYNADNEDFCRFLVENLRAKNLNYTIGKHFFDSRDVAFLAKTVAPTHGWKPTVYDIGGARWNPQQWLEVQQSASTLLDALLPTNVLISTTEEVPPTRKRSAADLDGKGASDQVALQIAKRRRRQLTRHFREYCENYSQFSRWIVHLIDNYRDQLFPRLLFIVFQHCYFDLVMLGSGKKAVDFYAQFEYQFKEFLEFKDDLIETRKVLTPEHMLENEACRRMRIKQHESLPTYPVADLDAVSRSMVVEPRRVVFCVTQDCYQFLMHNIRNMMPPKVANVLRTYVDFRIQ